MTKIGLLGSTRGTGMLGIADAIKQLAFKEMILPNQYQAVLWFTRKRIFNVKSEMQFDLLLPKGDLWKTLRNIKDLKPYPWSSKSTETLSSSMASQCQDQLALSESNG